MSRQCTNIGGYLYLSGLLISFSPLFFSFVLDHTRLGVSFALPKTSIVSYANTWAMQSNNKKGGDTKNLQLEANLHIHMFALQVRCIQ